MAFEPRCAVFQIIRRDDPQKYGTGFVIHIDAAASEKQAYILTCAHVVDELGKNTLTVAGNDAQLTAMGDQNGLDLAVIKVALPAAALRQATLATDGTLQDRVEVHGYLGERRVPLKAAFNKYEDLCRKKAGELRLYQFVLDPDEAIEPDELKQGYSGSPILLTEKGGHVFAVANTRRASQPGKHRVGACIPVWHLAEIWPEMPDRLGGELFGAAYWPLLQQVRAQAGTLTPGAYQQAFQAACGNPDEFPAEYSLWGCAMSLRKFESDSDSTGRLRGFLAALGLPGYSEQPPAAAAPGPAPAGNPPAVHVAPPSTPVYRQLIIRIVKRLASRRDDVGGRGGDKYWIEAHTAELDAGQTFCCPSGGKECVPYVVRTLSTTCYRRTGEERQSGLKELLQDEIPDILASFASHAPDLVQFVVPEELLEDLIVTDKIDQVLVRDGREPLAEWRPTIFSGAKLSNADEAGSDLLERLNHVSPLQGPVIGFSDTELNREVRGQLKEAIVAVLSTPAAVNRLLPHAPYFVPFVLVSEEKAEAVVDKVAALHCKCRLAHALHAQQYDDSLPERLPIIANTPNITIRFAEAEEPVIVGN